MASSDQTFEDAIQEFRRSGLSGLYRRIVQVSYLQAVEDGTPAWSWLETVILRFKRSVDTTYSSFAASASYSRAIAHYGIVEGRTLRESLDGLDRTSLSFADDVLSEVAKVDRQDASRRRRATGLRAEGTRWGETNPVLKSVETLVTLAASGDPAAARELDLIRAAVRE
jgi:hypothetical protein